MLSNELQMNQSCEYSARNCATFVEIRYWYFRSTVDKIIKYYTFDLLCSGKHNWSLLSQTGATYLVFCFKLRIRFAPVREIRKALRSTITIKDEIDWPVIAVWTIVLEAIQTFGKSLKQSLNFYVFRFVPVSI